MIKIRNYKELLKKAPIVDGVHFFNPDKEYKIIINNEEENCEKYRINNVTIFYNYDLLNDFGHNALSNSSRGFFNVLLDFLKELSEVEEIENFDIEKVKLRRVLYKVNNKVFGFNTDGISNYHQYNFPPFGFYDNFYRKNILHSIKTIIKNKPYYNFEITVFPFVLDKKTYCAGNIYGGGYFSETPKGYIDYNGERGLKRNLIKCPVCGKIGFKGELLCDCGYISGYHRDINYGAESKFSQSSNIKLGYELERDVRLDASDVIKLRELGFRYEEDGSVIGGEVISPVLGLKEVGYIFKKLPFLFGKKTSSRCGGHIHLSQEGVSYIELYDSIKYFRPILWSIFPTRVNNSYCSKDGNNKYRDVAIRSNLKTIEFRIFPGVDKIEDIIFRTRLLKFFLDNKNTNESEVKKIVKEKIDELVSIILIRYEKRTIPGMIERMEGYFNIKLK